MAVRRLVIALVAVLRLTWGSLSGGQMRGATAPNGRLNKYRPIVP